MGPYTSLRITSDLAGRLLCDTYLAARDLVKEVDYTLKTLSRSLLNQERHELTAADVPGWSNMTDYCRYCVCAVGWLGGAVLLCVGVRCSKDDVIATFMRS
jgi:hypothetical protein